jgi:hypothetical protein
MSIAAMKQALEFIDSVKVHPTQIATRDALHTALRAAIEQAEKQGPFGYFQYAPHFDAWVQNRDSNEGVPFYTAPRQWVGLTNKDIIEMWPETSTVGWDDIRLIEAKLKEKNT